MGKVFIVLVTHIVAMQSNASSDRETYEDLLLELVESHKLPNMRYAIRLPEMTKNNYNLVKDQIHSANLYLGASCITINYNDGNPIMIFTQFNDGSPYPDAARIAYARRTIQETDDNK